MPLKLNLAIPNKAVHVFIGIVVISALVVGVYAYTFPGGFIGHGGDNVWINTAGGETTLQTAIDGGLLGADDDWEKVGGGEPVLADNMYHTGNVGIGTTAPGDKLHIANPGGGNQVGIYFEDPTATAYGGRIYFDDTSNTFRFGTVENTVNVLGISVARATGNVGIGTTNPSQKLEVNGNLKLSTANPYIYSGGSYIVIPNGLYVSGGTTYIQGSLRPRGGIYNDTASYLTISGGTSGNTYFPGNVGIGTTSPSQKLDVAGYVKGQTGLCVGSDCRTAWPAAGTGDITEVKSGVGTKGGATSDVALIEFDCSDVSGTGIICSGETINADTSYVQRKVINTCASNQAIRVINNDGTVSCLALPSSALCTWSGNTYSTGYFCWNGTTCSVTVPGNSCECQSDGTWECSFHFSGHTCPVLCGR